MTNSHSKLETRLQTRYQKQVEETSVEDRRRLAQSRRAALAAAEEKAMPWLRWSWVPAGAAASVLAVMLWPSHDMNGDLRMAASTVDDLEILLAEEDLEFYSDLDFYLWLGEEMHETS